MNNRKWTAIGKVFTIAAALTLGLAITLTASAQYKGCSNASLRGSFTQTGSGVITSPPDQAGPFANVGRLYFDGNGGVTGALTISQNRMSAQATEMGTCTVNSDCTGTYTVQMNPFGFSSQAFFAIDSNGDDVKIIVPDTGSVNTCVAKKLFPGGAI